MNRDEDLLLFRDMYKREKNELASFLLLPVSNELEANGMNFKLFNYFLFFINFRCFFLVVHDGEFFRSLSVVLVALLYFHRALFTSYCFVRFSYLIFMSGFSLRDSKN